MAKSRLHLESANDVVSTIVPTPSVTGLIVTKQDKAVWAECCNRMLCSPKDRAIRYFHIGGHGITAVLKTGDERQAGWRYPATLPV